MAGLKQDIEGGFLSVWKPFKGQAVFVLALFLVSAVVETLGIGSIMPFLEIISGGNRESGVARFLANFGFQNEEDRLLLVGGGLVAIFFVRSLVVLLREYYSTQFANLLREYWSFHIFRNYLYGDMLALKGIKQGHFINTMINEPIYAAKGMAALLDVIVSVLILVFILAFLLFLNGPVTLAAMLIVALGAGCVWGLSARYSENVGKARIQLNQQINQLITEAVGGIRQIKVFSAESRALADMKDRLAKLMHKLNMFALVNASPKAVGDFLVVVVIVGSLLIGKFVLGRDVASLLPEIGVFAVAFMKLFSLASLILSKRMEIATYWPSICLVHKQASMEEEEKHDANAAAVPFKHSLTAKNLSFAFSDKTILDSISFQIDSGEIIGLAGRSGSGKSTICDLVAKLLLPSAGVLEADGVNLASVGLSQWRSRLGYVSQETFLFNASVLENILIARPSASRQEVEAAAKLADADAFIKTLPDGYDTVVGAGGAGLSGGQRQRIALARALVRKPDLLILDEATSALDAQSEAHILQALRKGEKKMTTVIVTHRLNTLKIADRILFLDQGKIVEEGRFDRLCAAKGAFSKLVDSDFSEGETRA